MMILKVTKNKVLHSLQTVHFLKYSLRRHTGIPGLWTQVLDAGLWKLDSGPWTLDTRPWTLDAGLWTLDAGLWTLDPGLSMLDVGRWTLHATRLTLGSGHWTISLTVLEQNQKPVSDSAWLDYWKFSGCESLRTSWSPLLCRGYRFWLGYF